jgi:hypothetical protein
VQSTSPHAIYKIRFNNILPRLSTIPTFSLPLRFVNLNFVSVSHLVLNLGLFWVGESTEECTQGHDGVFFPISLSVNTKRKK